MSDKARALVLGASGYSGGELLRLLMGHGGIEIGALTADRRAGEEVGSVHPHLAFAGLPRFRRLDELEPADFDVAFCCLPHGTTQEIIASLPSAMKVVDLSADFRLRDPAFYERVYGGTHRARGLQKDAVYGLTEHYRDAISKTRLVANPGCYTTTSELALIPLLRAELIAGEGVVIDAKSGVSGAGRALRDGSLFSEAADSMKAYGVGEHRHQWEINQCLSDFAAKPVEVLFAPHLAPMNRGILATCYVTLAGGAAPEDLHRALALAYEGEPFVHVAPLGRQPATRDVRGSNNCVIGVAKAAIGGRAVVTSVTDNLVKGAAGQALQNMNLLLGLDEREGLRGAALAP